MNYTFARELKCALILVNLYAATHIKPTLCSEELRDSAVINTVLETGEKIKKPWEIYFLRISRRCYRVVFRLSVLKNYLKNHSIFYTFVWNTIILNLKWAYY